MSEGTITPWVCAQLGSREHYAIPRMLHRRGRLRLLLTDYWTSPRGGVAAVAPGRDAAKAAQRFHPELADAAVEQLGARRLVFEIVARLTRQSGWPVILRRNRLFQGVMLRRLRERWLPRLASAPGVFFGYSYAALDLMRAFRAIGWKTVLGQIDPGVREEEVVAAEHARRPELASRWRPAPPEYWTRWRGECGLCDRIVVNSPWSRDALVASGIVAEKIDVVPLAFEPKPAPRVTKQPPECFTDERPMRVLFLGQLNVRKGAHLALEAARMLRDEPVKWHFVGPAEIALPADLAESHRVHWSGPVSRAATAALYEAADAFLLPTLSDGFALTQLEAQAAGTPVLASRFCGAVVRDGINGWIIDPLDVETICGVIRRGLEQPNMLARLARASAVDPEFSLEALGRNLERIEEAVLPRTP